MVELVAHGASHGEALPVVGQQKKHAGAGSEPVQRLMNRSRDRVCRGSGVTEGRARLCQAMRLRSGPLGGHAAGALAPDCPQRPHGEQRDKDTDTAKAANASDSDAGDSPAAEKHQSFHHRRA